MRAAWIEEYGGPEVIRMGNFAEPERTSGEVLVRVEAATINHRDIYLRRGQAGRHSLPLVLGSDAAGVVLNADPGSGFSEGQPVVVYPVLSCGLCVGCRSGAEHKCIKFGMIGGDRPGTQAEFLSLPERCLVPRPDGLDPIAAAATSLAGLTAWNMAIVEGKSTRGEHALVLGASGGVGSFLVPLLRHLGLHVTAVTSSPEKQGYIYDLGCEDVLPDDGAAVLREARKLPDSGFDLAFNLVGAATWRYVLPAVRPGGRILTCGSVRSPVAEIDIRQLFYRNVALLGTSMGSRESLIAALDAVARESSLRVPVSECVPISGVREAHETLESGGAQGKIVIVPGK